MFRWEKREVTLLVIILILDFIRLLLRLQIRIKHRCHKVFLFLRVPWPLEQGIRRKLSRFYFTITFVLHHEQTKGLGRPDRGSCCVLLALLLSSWLFASVGVAWVLCRSCRLLITLWFLAPMSTSLVWLWGRRFLHGSFVLLLELLLQPVKLLSCLLISVKELSYLVASYVWSVDTWVVSDEVPAMLSWFQVSEWFWCSCFAFR